MGDSDETGRGDIVRASILKTYLRLNLLELGGDDSRLEKLDAAASELAIGLSEAPEDALPVFLAVLRSDQEVGNAFIKVADAIENHWVTYRGAFQDGTAMTLYRAVALQALVEAIDFQPVLGTAISLLMRNFGPRLEIGKNKAAFDLLVGAADAAFEAESKESMAPPVEPRSVVPKVGKLTKVDRAALQKLIEAAVGPHNRAGEAGANPNPQWTDSGTPWSHDFSDRLTMLLADYLDAAVSRASESAAKNLDALGNSFREVTARGDSAVKRATSLLWWRQALYSESAMQPYRELQPTDAIVHAVIDLSALIPAAYERALESFIMEAILSILPSQDEITESEMLKVARKASSALHAGVESRVPSGLVLSAILQNDAADVRVSLPPQKWAVWLLRELNAIRALRSPKPVPEKKGRDDD